MTYRSAQPKRKKLGWKLPLAVLSIALLVLAGLELTDKIYLFHDKKVPVTIPSTKPVTAPEVNDKKTDTKSTPSTTSGGAESSASATPKSPQASTPDTKAPLVAPYGVFVSNHFPGRNGSPSKEESLCNSTPGASCYMEFRNTTSGETTRLASQTINSQGSTSWSWDAKILPNGKWQVTAVAVRGAEIKKTSDPILLEVSL